MEFYFFCSFGAFSSVNIESYCVPGETTRTTRTQFLSCRDWWEKARVCRKEVQEVTRGVGAGRHRSTGEEREEGAPARWVREAGMKKASCRYSQSWTLDRSRGSAPTVGPWVQSLSPDPPERTEGLCRRAPGGVVLCGPGVPGGEGAEGEAQEVLMHVWGLGEGEVNVKTTPWSLVVGPWSGIRDIRVGAGGWTPCVLFWMCWARCVCKMYQWLCPGHVGFVSPTWQAGQGRRCALGTHWMYTGVKTMNVD